MKTFSEKLLRDISKICGQELVFDKRIVLPNGNPKTAAVLVPLCNHNGRASVVFTLRTQLVGTHKGQVSFPGGHTNMNETPEDCAIRETNEEIQGLGSIQILGKAQRVPAITGTIVTPVIGFVQEDVQLSKLTVSRAEVDHVFIRPLEDLMNPQLQSSENLQRGFQMPVFLGGEERIWGLTAFILHNVLYKAIAPALEINNINYSNIKSNNIIQSN